MAKRHLAGEVGRHHDHPGDPEEDDVEAGDEHARRQEQVLLDGPCRPAQRRERHQRRRIPGVEHVGIALQRSGIAVGAGLGAGLGLAARDIELAVDAVPGRDLVAPPQLARDAPVLDVAEPLVVGIDPLLGHEPDLARGHRVDGLLRDAPAAGAGPGHRDEPLVGQHRLDDLPGARAARHRQAVLLRLDEQAERVEVGHHLLARGVAVEAAVRRRGVVVDPGVERQDADDRQPVALADRVVAGIVRRRDLDDTGAEGAVDAGVGDDRDLALAQRQPHRLADVCRVAPVVGVDHHRGVAEHRLGAGGGHHQPARVVGQRVGDMPQEAVLLLALDLEVGDGRHQHRVPVDEPFAAVDQAFLVQPHEGLGDDVRERLVHREVLARPVDAGAQAPHLVGDRRAALPLPGPDALDEGGAAEVVARAAFVLQLALDDDLGRDAGMVGAGQPQRVVAAHAVPARQRVHDRLVERMPHVQRAGDVGRRQLDRERGPRRVQARGAEAVALPPVDPARLDGRGVVGLGEFAHGVVLGVSRRARRGCANDGDAGNAKGPGGEPGPASWCR